MKSYQASIYRKDNKLQVSKIEEKDIANPMFVIEEEEVTILQVFDQDKGRIMLFISGKKSTLESFLSGFELGMKSDTLLI